MELQSRALIMNVHSHYEALQASVAFEVQEEKDWHSVSVTTDLFSTIFLCVMSAFSSSFLQYVL